MPTNQTSNYALNQWERTDKVLMEDFNADNAKIDEALKTEADVREAGITTLTAGLALKGNCQIVWGSYFGTDQAGKNYPNVLTFAHKPLLVFVMPEYISEAGSNPPPLHTFFLQGSTKASLHIDSRVLEIRVSWEGNTLSWYSNSDISGYQFNLAKKYFYVAFLAADD